jgi:hypothetical protein
MFGKAAKGGGSYDAAFVDEPLLGFKIECLVVYREIVDMTTSERFPFRARNADKRLLFHAEVRNGS